jgi:hypothetical protein
MMGVTGGRCRNKNMIAARQEEECVSSRLSLLGNDHFITRDVETVLGHKDLEPKSSGLR